MSTATIWRQHIAVKGDSLRLLEKISDIATLPRDQSSNALIVRGDGPFFPAMRGISWAAMCGQRYANDIILSDITSILRTLLDATPIPTSDAPREEIEAWLQAFQGEAR